MNADVLYILRIQYQPNAGGSVTTDFPLGDAPLIVGGAREADIQLPVPHLSARHLQIQVLQQRVYVTDLGSQNGTTIAGRRLPPLQRQEWRPGEALLVAQSLRAEIIPRTSQQPNFTLTPVEFAPGQPARLSITNPAYTEQHYYFRVAADAPGVEIALRPNEALIPPGQSAMLNVESRATRSFWLGGRVGLHFSALTNEGGHAETYGAVRIKPRYDLLTAGLLLLFMLLCGGTAATVALIAVVNRPQPTPTLPPSATPFVTLTPLPTLPPGVTPTITPLPTPTIRAPGGVMLPAPQPDIAIQAAVTGRVSPGSPYPIFAQVSIFVTNAGGAGAGAVSFASVSGDSIIGSWTGTGWACNIQNMRVIHCTHPGPLAAGATLPPVVVAHNYGRVFTVQITAPNDGNGANNVAATFPCVGDECTSRDFWLAACRANPQADVLQHSPPAPGACQQWRTAVP